MKVVTIVGVKSALTRSLPKGFRRIAGGSIDSQGLFTARSTEGGPYTVSASAGTIRGTALARVGDGPSDTEAPTVAITGLPEDGVLSGAFNLRVEVSDNVGVTEVTWLLDGKPLGVVTGAPFIFMLATTSFENGEHLLEATAADASGNAARSGAVTITIDNQGFIEPETVMGAGCSTAGGSPLTYLLLLAGAWLRRARR